MHWRYLCQPIKMWMKSAVGSVKNNTLSLLLSDFKEITKAKLAVSVVFSSIAGYFLGAYQIDIVSLLLLMFGGYCMVGASNAYNQIIENKVAHHHIKYKGKKLVVLCHMGIRSYNFGTFLLDNKFVQEVWNLEDGIDGWSKYIDANVPRY